jgi:hypothetical protein
MSASLDLLDGVYRIVTRACSQIAVLAGSLSPEPRDRRNMTQM